MGQTVFKVFIVVLTVYMMTGFILNKICELKGCRWYNFYVRKPDEDAQYLVITKDDKINIARYDVKNFEFSIKNVKFWRKLPELPGVQNRRQLNIFYRKRDARNEK